MNPNSEELNAIREAYVPSAPNSTPPTGAASTSSAVFPRPSSRP